MHDSYAGEPYAVFFYFTRFLNGNATFGVLYTYVPLKFDSFWLGCCCCPWFFNDGIVVQIELLSSSLKFSLTIHCRQNVCKQFKQRGSLKISPHIWHSNSSGYCGGSGDDACITKASDIGREGCLKLKL